MQTINDKRRKRNGRKYRFHVDLLFSCLTSVRVCECARGHAQTRLVGGFLKLIYYNKPRKHVLYS